MGRIMKALAIAALLVTILGAGALLYAINNLSPVVVQANVTLTTAQQAQDIFDMTAAQLADETFTGRVFGDASGLNAQDCTFVTYTVRLENKGFFPAEWVSLDVHPAQGEGAQDICQLDNFSANVLASRTQGDIAATMLTRGDVSNTQRTYTVTCYVFGQKISFNGVIG